MGQYTSVFSTKRQARTQNIGLNWTENTKEQEIRTEKQRKQERQDKKIKPYGSD
ncbi:hypothetical protein [Intestinimonas massiliensis (ex Afouda et al. 2020)]|uniref:hypothetical protein n=1 Tax=Intestinimonas massiliensis (ex Afouda et al. 2020) TaxID=1673721 RepID=UPI0013EF59B8|nr:hypothetical protein [Intestinimonas massiliensis (ex Afouda et al. 2020)]